MFFEPVLQNEYVYVIGKSDRSQFFSDGILGRPQWVKDPYDARHYKDRNEAVKRLEKLSNEGGAIYKIDIGWFEIDPTYIVEEAYIKENNQ